MAFHRNPGTILGRQNQRRPTGEPPSVQPVQPSSVFGDRPRMPRESAYILKRNGYLPISTAILDRHVSRLSFPEAFPLTLLSKCY